MQVRLGRQAAVQPGKQAAGFVAWPISGQNLGRQARLAERNEAELVYHEEACRKALGGSNRPSGIRNRIASVLQRASWVGDMPIPLSQTDLGIMANASRQQVNTAMQRFARAGWVSYTYRSVTVSNSQALRRFSEGDGSEW